jgi:hypothetical protein
MFSSQFTDLDPQKNSATEKNCFELLDTVFRDFIKTNQRRNKTFSLQDILQIDVYNPMYFRYTHDDMPYLASLQNIADPDKDLIHIQLFSKNFNPILQDCQNVLGVINSDQLLKGYIRQAFDGFSDMYTFKERRLYLKIYLENDNVPNVLLTLEKGYPYFDDQIKRIPL